jgi:hypothetical protein
MKEGGIEVLHVMDWLKREENEQSINSVFADWIKLIDGGKAKTVYSTKQINKTFYTVINLEIKPTGK